MNEKTQKKIYGYNLTDKAAHVAMEDGKSALPFMYVPGVSPGLIFIMHPDKIEIDGNFEGNLYVTDMCVNTWSEGKKVAASMTLEITGDGLLTGDETNEKDFEHFRSKWCYFIKAQLFLNEDIKILKMS
ncbi:MAG: hypothetical protein HQK92_12085 [Nitrospirae bacterium]|nr:hypothetical protein [Nitrospirota bacterium]